TRSSEPSPTCRSRRRRARTPPGPKRPAGRDGPGRHAATALEARVKAAGLDWIELTGLRARGRHGCLPAERELGQEFVVDVALGLDTRPAAASDDLSLTVDYGSLADRLVAVVTGEP